MRGATRWAAVGVAGLVLVAGCGGSGGSGSEEAGSEETEVRTTVEVPSYPWWPNEVLRQDQALLDELATGYGAQADDPLDTERFLYGWAPVRAFDRILREDPDDDEARALLWLLHVSGYFGGVWLRGAIDRAQPGTSAIADLFVEPTRTGFEATVAEADSALAADGGNDDGVLAYNEASLFPQQADTFTGDGLAQGFGYNQGYMLQILEAPPSGLATPDRYQVSCAGVFSCDYATPRLEALVGLEPVATALSAAEPPYADLAPRLAEEQDAFVPKGRAVWSGGLSVEGFTQRDYETLLDVSSSFLEALQATGLAAARAVAEGDAATGRRAVLADAAMGIWLKAYTTGLTQGRDATEVPRIRRSAPASS